MRNVGKRTAGGAEAEALTAVDLAAQDVILRRLLEAMPGIGVDAEEETALAERAPPSGERPLVVLDPIDGTLNYSRGSPDYAVMAALVVDRRYRAAVVHLPERRATWWALEGLGCHRSIEAVPQTESVRVGRLPRIALGVPRLPRAWADALRGLGLEVRTSRCSAIDAGSVAIGDACAAVDPGPPDRRRAIGFLLATEAGGVVRVGDEAWDGRDPQAFALAGPSVVASSASLASRILRALPRSPAGSR